MRSCKRTCSDQTRQFIKGKRWPRKVDTENNCIQTRFICCWCINFSVASLLSYPGEWNTAFAVLSHAWGLDSSLVGTTVELFLFWGGRGGGGGGLNLERLINNYYCWSFARILTIKVTGGCESPLYIQIFISIIFFWTATLLEIYLNRTRTL